MTADLIFVSVGGTATEEQEAFVRLIEERLRSEGLTPRTVGRNTFSSDAPLKAITELMASCSGVVVIALERSWFPSGLDKRGGPLESPLAETKLPTPWNHIEAAMAYVRHLPLLVIVEAGLKPEGLLEPGYDWYVQLLPLQEAALHTNEFNGVFADWKEKVLHPSQPDLPRASPRPNPADLSLAELVGGLRPVQLWSVLIAAVGVLAATFSLGLRLAPSLEKSPRPSRLPPTLQDTHTAAAERGVGGMVTDVAIVMPAALALAPLRPGLRQGISGEATSPRGVDGLQ